MVWTRERRQTREKKKKSEKQIRSWQNSNYIIRRVGTNYTQCVHRIRLRPVVLHYQPNDVELIDTTKLETDLSLGKYQSEPGLFDDYGGTAVAPASAGPELSPAAPHVAPRPIPKPAPLHFWISFQRMQQHTCKSYHLPSIDEHSPAGLINNDSDAEGYNFDELF